METPRDIELWRIDPAANAFRVYAVTECRTLFGEWCLRIVWGRLGTRPLRERSEIFRDEAALARRRDALLKRRMRSGYAPSPKPPRLELAPPPAPRPVAHAKAPVLASARPAYAGIPPRPERSLWTWSKGR